MTNKNENLQLPTERVGIYKVGEGVLINKDSKSLSAYKLRKSKMRDIDRINDTIDELKSDMKDIKAMLYSIATNKKME